MGLKVEKIEYASDETITRQKKEDWVAARIRERIPDNDLPKEKYHDDFWMQVYFALQTYIEYQWHPNMEGAWDKIGNNKIAIQAVSVAAANLRLEQAVCDSMYENGDL